MYKPLQKEISLFNYIQKLKTDFSNFAEFCNKYLPDLKRNDNATAERHPYHLVKASPKPILAAFILFMTLSHFLQYLSNIWGVTPEFQTTFHYSFFMVQLNYILFIVLLFTWMWYLHFESTYLGKYTTQVKAGLRLGFKLFVLSEIMFFAGAFWAYLHGALNPSILIGLVWPPRGIHMGHWSGIPALETIVLVTSGLTLTSGYNLFLRNNRNGLLIGLIFTIIFALFFLSLQFVELTQLLQFNINDSFYGSTFYFAVGCHAFHVFLGSVALIIALIRHTFSHFLRDSHTGLQATLWYWHFVDIVWIFLFLIYYVWGSTSH